MIKIIPGFYSPREPLNNAQKLIMLKVLPFCGRGMFAFLNLYLSGVTSSIIKSNLDNSLENLKHFGNLKVKQSENRNPCTILTNVIKTAPKINVSGACQHEQQKVPNVF